MPRSGRMKRKCRAFATPRRKRICVGATRLPHRFEPCGQTLKPQSFGCRLVPERRLGCRKPRDRHSIGRGRDVIEPGLLAEGDRRRIAAMFAANTKLELVL